MSDDTSTIDRVRGIARLTGEIHAQLIELRRAGLPPKALAGLAAIETKLNDLADANAALGEPESSHLDAA